MNAGLAAEEAADRMQEIEDRAERGKDAMSDVFGAILEGAGSAKQAIANLLMEMAKIQFMRGIFGLPGWDLSRAPSAGCSSPVMQQVALPASEAGTIRRASCIAAST